MENFLPIFVVSLISICMARHHHVDVPDVLNYFNVVDPINITWAHAVNSVEKLKDVLAGDQMMIEADIVIGKLNDQTDDIPIMAHPPDSTSDMSFENFLMNVIDAVDSETSKKGIKLDFKQIEAVEPGLKILKQLQKNIHFPVWLNADVLQGPVNSTKNPVNAKKFLSLTQLYFPKATLSLGWTTRYGKDQNSMLDNTSDVKEITSGKYEHSQINQMIELLDGVELKSRPTFAVRAGLAENSVEDLMTLSAFGKITLWSAKGDRVDMGKLQELVTALGRQNVYMDLPFDLYAEPIPPRAVMDRNQNNSSDHSTNTHGKNNSTDNNNILPSVPDSAMSVMTKNLQVVVFLVSLLLINQYLFN